MGWEIEETLILFRHNGSIVRRGSCIPLVSEIAAHTLIIIMDVKIRVADSPHKPLLIHRSLFPRKT